MKSSRLAAQALVEFAVLVPTLLILAIVIFDGGGVLREQLILQEAARAGARVAATGYGTVPAAQIISAARAAGSDIPLSAADPVSTDSATGLVTVSHAHQLYTPVLRQLWGNGTGLVTLSARAQFLVPSPPPAPAQPQQTESAPCSFTVDMPPLSNNSGWFSPPFQLADGPNPGYFRGRILIRWSVTSQNVEVALYGGNYSGQANPVVGSQYAPQNIPGVIQIVSSGGPTTGLSIDATGPQITPLSTYTVYFFNYGAAVVSSSVGTITFLKAGCP
jgi:Flp pilus assembly protein TadG